MSVQQYQELFVAMACMSYGVLGLWAPDRIRFLGRASRTRVAPTLALVLGAVGAVVAVLGL